METRYFTGFLRDCAQKGRRGNLAHAARQVLTYVRGSADSVQRLRDRFDADLKQNRIDPERRARLHEMLDSLAERWKNSDKIVDVRDARDWRACGNGHRRVDHREVSFEDDPRAFDPVYQFRPE